MNLVIVESPTKVKTIGKYLGKDYTVLSSKGHIRDLPKKELGVDVDHDFAPVYTTMPGKEKVVKELQKAAKSADTIYLATDLDREGEAISWHVMNIISEKSKVKSQKFERVVFHEITKPAIEEAFKHPREINYDLVDAYQARRVLDRVVGYKLSPLLWEKIRYGLSAGRVQSVAVRLIVERERERERFETEQYFQFTANLKHKKDTLSAQLYQYKNKKVEQKEKLELFAGDYTVTKTIFTDPKEVDILKKEFAGQVYQVLEVEDKEVTRNARPPLATARLQRQAVNALGFTSKRTMRAAQKLYEAGHITYHRTDSVFLSDQFIQDARGYIKKAYGDKYIPEKPNYYASQTKTQEAHEAIRPTDAGRIPDAAEINKLSADEKKVYELIWRHALASQMAPAVVRQLRVDIGSGKSAEEALDKPIGIWRATGNQLVFPGWMKVLKSEVSDTLLPPVEEKETFEAAEVVASEHATQPPPRYTEASLIKDLEKYGIGRPSTYAPTIDTIESRKYVQKDGKAFFPMDTGIVVNDLLVRHFPHIVDLEFTAEMEESLDEIANGEREWVPIIAEFYKPFIKMIETKKKEIKKEDIVVLEQTNEICPECGKNLIVKLGKYGKFLSCSGFPDCEYAAPLEQDEHGEIKEVEQQEFGTCPECNEGTLMLKEGRYGKFIACSNYPKCKHTQNYNDSIDMKCPECNEGDVVKKRTRKGRMFYGCSRYPDCEYSSWKDPRGDTEKS